jgi:hypothetical protein
MLNLCVPSSLDLHASPPRSHAPGDPALLTIELRREDHFGPSLMVVTQILRDLRPHHSWSPHCSPNFPKSNAASTWLHIPSNIRSVGKWMGVVTGDGRSGYADFGTIDKIEERKWDMHNFWVGFDHSHGTWTYWQYLLSLFLFLLDYSAAALRFLATQNAAYN